MSYKIIEFNAKDYEADNPFWDDYYEYVKASSKERNPDEPVLSKEHIIKRQHQQQEFFKFQVKTYLLYYEKKICAWCGLGYYEKDHPEYETNGHTMQGNIVVLNEFQRKGMGTALLRQILTIGKQQGIKNLFGGFDNEPAKNFMAKYGAKIIIEGAENRLQMEDLDWDLMQKWVDEGPKRAECVKLKFYTDIPDEILDEYLEVLNESLNLQPLGEMTTRTNITREMYADSEKKSKDLGSKRFTYLSIEPDTSISGITEIYSQPEREYRLEQGITGVRPKYRGRGLGKWLKAQMMFYIRDEFPDVQFISTGNATENAPMLSINHRMGYKEFKGGSSVEFDIAKTCELLNV